MSSEPAPPSDQPTADALYAELQPLVRRLLRKYGGTPEERGDLAAELYVRFRSLLASYDPDRGVPLRPYLVRMLIVSAYSSERQRWRRAAREVSLERLGAETDVALIPANDPVSDWVEHLHVERVLLQLSQALRQLPDRQRQVVVWRYYEGRSFEEIAAALQIRPATARSLLRHGVNRLRGLLWQCRE